MAAADDEPSAAQSADGPPDVPPDVVVGADPSLLDGVKLEYRYSSGRAYRLAFAAEEVTFTMLDAPSHRPELGVPITLPYLARMTREELVLVHWMVPGRSGHVSLIIDYDARKLFVSALMPFKAEFFDVADLSLVERPA